MKSFLKTSYPLIISIIAFCFPVLTGYSQTAVDNSILLTAEATTIAINEPFILHLSFPSSFKKEYKSAQNILFPDIPDLVKGQTVYEEDDLRISQWYWPAKSGTYPTPAISFKIRDYEVSMPQITLVVKNTRSDFSYTPTELDEPWQEETPNIELLLLVPKTGLYEKELFDLELSVLVPMNNQAEWTFVDIREQVQEITKRIGSTGLLVQHIPDANIPVDTFEKNNSKFYKYTIYKAQALSLDTTLVKIPTLNFHYLSYKTQTEQKGLFNNKKTLVNRKPLTRELSTRITSLQFKALPPHPLRDQVAVGNFHLRSTPLKRTQSTRGFDLAFEVTGSSYPLSLHEPWVIEHIPGLHVYLSKRNVSTGKSDLQRTRFEYFIHADSPRKINLKNSLIWVYFNPDKHRYDTLAVNRSIVFSNEAIADHNTNPENSFSHLLHNTSNTVYSLEKDESLNRFANVIIFILFLAISVLIFKR